MWAWGRVKRVKGSKMSRPEEVQMRRRRVVTAGIKSQEGDDVMQSICAGGECELR